MAFPSKQQRFEAGGQLLKHKQGFPWRSFFFFFPLEIFLSEELAGVRAVQYPNCLCLNPGTCLCMTVLRANHLYLGAFDCIGLQRLLPAGFAICALLPHGGVERVTRSSPGYLACCTEL